MVVATKILRDLLIARHDLRNNRHMIIEIMSIISIGMIHLAISRAISVATKLRDKLHSVTAP